jgi:hypothetical protein
LHLKGRFFALLLPLVSLGLTGCNELGLRRGPPPVLDVASIQSASGNQTMIIDALAVDASDAGVFVDGTDRYYRIAEAGFNYVDDQCQSYFDQLFFIDRGRSQIKSGLAAAGATTAAILGVTNASTLTMAVVASAFGFASTATDIVAGTYLYALPPATTQGLVTKLQNTYRDEALKMRAQINTPTAAYHHIQSYLALCLPPRIEAEVVNAIGAASVNVVKGDSGSTFSVGSGGPVVTPPAQTTIRVIATNPVPVPQVPTPTPGALNAFEANMNPVGLARIQTTLCVEPTSKWDSPTRSAILNFFDGFDHNSTKHSYVTKDGITKGDAGILVRAITVSKQLGAAAPKDCSTLTDEQRVDWQKTLGNSIQ